VAAGESRPDDGPAVPRRTWRTVPAKAVMQVAVAGCAARRRTGTCSPHGRLCRPTVTPSLPGAWPQHPRVAPHRRVVDVHDPVTGTSQGGRAPRGRALRVSGTVRAPTAPSSGRPAAADFRTPLTAPPQVSGGRRTSQPVRRGMRWGHPP
jgi:hypothetical protein